MTNSQASNCQNGVVKNERPVRHPDVVFDSNVVDWSEAKDKKLLSLTEKLLARPRTGNVWFSLPSLYELLAPKVAARRIELLKRFQNLYTQFGHRVRFFDLDWYSFVAAEWSNEGFRSAPANMIDKAVTASIAAGDLVGYLKTWRDTWIKDKDKIHEKHTEDVQRLSKCYESEQWFRDEFKRSIERYGTADALEQCDRLVRALIVSYTQQPPEAVLVAKANHAEYPCTWTYALLARLAHYAATLTKAERELNFAHYGELLKADRNDDIDAYIAASGGMCGRLITNDRPLVQKVNFLHDASPSLIRLQAFTVDDALKQFNPVDGDV